MPFDASATILGIRLASMGFQTVFVRPQLGPLDHVRGKMVVPQGWVEVDLRRNGKEIVGTVELPPGLTGSWICGKNEAPLVAGRQEVRG